ncbi:MAG: RNA pyrophosphohydrolase [Halothiobacillaceae bacterium]
MIDSEGYRPNVGIILVNAENRVFWARRVGQQAWQFPQGGIRCEESPLEAMFRELREETGLLPEHVRLLGCTRDWLRYRLPSNLVRKRGFPVCIGQKQKWFLLRLLVPDQMVRLDCGRRPEFDAWRWVDYWQPLSDVVSFKRDVYVSALSELAPLLFPPERCAPSARAAEQLKRLRGE